MQKNSSCTETAQRSVKCKLRNFEQFLESTGYFTRNVS